jgi:WD40 repeat protein
MLCSNRLAPWQSALRLSVTALAFLPAGLSGQVPSVEKSHTLDEGRSVRGITFSAAGKRAATCTDQSESVQLWDGTTGKKLGTCLHEDVVSAVALRPDGRVLAAGVGSGVWLWNPGSARGVLVRPANVLSAPGDVASLTFSPNGKLLAAACWEANEVAIWLSKGTDPIVCRGHSDYVTAVAFSHDGKLVASGGRDRDIRLWNTANGDATRTCAGHTDEVFSLAFTSDGKLLASGSRDGTVRIWDVQTGAELHTLAGHTDEVYAIAISSDDKWLVSGGADKSVRLWDLAAFREIVILDRPQDLVRAILFTDAGKRLAFASGGEVQVWRFEE